LRLLARLRRGRALHPVGVGYHARLEITPGARRWAGARLLVPGARYDAVVRFSRGAGLPEPLPDALGVAVRLPDAYGPGRAQDFLVTSSATGELVFELRLAGSLGRSRTVGLLAIGDPLDPAATEALRFNPWTTGQDIVPIGRLNRLRRPSYASSQQGRSRARRR
jgi:hypothetical protein